MWRVFTIGQAQQLKIDGRRRAHTHILLGVAVALSLTSPAGGRQAARRIAFALSAAAEAR